jgi:exonuclease SbcC
MINRVKMINWRAYEQYEVSFEPGITFIMGANGAGKTSILEAIAYALTGEPSTVKDRRKLLRNPRIAASVEITFTVNGQTYRVERSQSQKQAGSAHLMRLKDNKRLASSHRQVTKQIERLMGVSAGFLQRIIYMAEGDVFRFLEKPPKEALDLQIRQVLGLTQLDEFVNALEMAEKELGQRIRELQGILADYAELGERGSSIPEHHMQEIDERRGSLLAELRNVQGAIAASRYEDEELQRLSNLLAQALPVLERDPEIWQMAMQRPVLALVEELEGRVSRIQSMIQQAREDWARLQGEQAAQQKILEILEPYVDRAETLPCPVCSKPMTPDERSHITQDIQQNLAFLVEKANSIKAQQSKSEEQLEKMQRVFMSVRELRNFLTHSRLNDPSARILDLREATRSQSDGAPIKLNEEAHYLEAQLARLESEKVEFLAILHRLKSLGCNSPEEASDALIGLETRALSLRAAQRAAQETLTAQRNADMTTIYDQVARVWDMFTGDVNSRIELDTKGMPTLKNGEGRELDLSQFSGGEKTALLIMLHTIIAQYFSRSDFLLIDEPLEHLDPINRRSLIRFLVGSHRRKSFEQAIIATFEESLIRKYMSEKDVHVIHLA